MLAALPSAIGSTIGEIVGGAIAGTGRLSRFQRMVRENVQLASNEQRDAMGRPINQASDAVPIGRQGPPAPDGDPNGDVVVTAQLTREPGFFERIGRFINRAGDWLNRTVDGVVSSFGSDALVQRIASTVGAATRRVPAFDIGGRNVRLSYTPGRALTATVGGVRATYAIGRGVTVSAGPARVAVIGGDIQLRAGSASVEFVGSAVRVRTPSVSYVRDDGIARLTVGSTSLLSARTDAGQVYSLTTDRVSAAYAVGRVFAVETSLPRGFATAKDFGRFGSSLYRGLDESGYADTRGILQGSAVTGYASEFSRTPGAPFDVGRTSDFDVALAGSSVFQAAQDAGIGLRSAQTRTGPLNERALRRLGLFDLSSRLSAQAGRPVNFMIYRSTVAAEARGPSVIIPR